jgi:hypothetical protein
LQYEVITIYLKNPEKDPFKIAKIGQGHQCMRKENLSVNNNCIIKELSIAIINISNKPCNFRNTDYGADDIFWLS